MTSTTKHQHKSSLTQPSLLRPSELRLNRWCSFMLSLVRTVMSAIHWEWDCKTLRENSWKNGSMTFQVECEPIPMCANWCAWTSMRTRDWMYEKQDRSGWVGEHRWVNVANVEMSVSVWLQGIVGRSVAHKWWWCGTRITLVDRHRCCEGVCVRAPYVKVHVKGGDVAYVLHKWSNSMALCQWQRMDKV